MARFFYKQTLSFLKPSLFFFMPTFANVADQAPDIKATAAFNIWNVNSDMVNCQHNVKSTLHRDHAPKQM